MLAGTESNALARMTLDLDGRRSTKPVDDEQSEQPRNLRRIFYINLVAGLHGIRSDKATSCKECFKLAGVLPGEV